MAFPLMQVLLCLALCGLVATTAATPSPILSYAYDTSRTGFAVDDILIKSNVQNFFTVQRNLSTNGAAVSAQPLYVHGLTIGGNIHNVVFIATGSAAVFAYDADTGASLWTTDFLALSGDKQAVLANTHRGIQGTPVIDPGTNTIYVVAVTVDKNSGNPNFRLHGLDLLTGAERPGSGVVVKPSVATAPFDPAAEMQQPGLAFQNGVVYVGICGNGGPLPHSGWLLSYNTTAVPYSLKGQFATVQTGNPAASPGGGIWMSGGAPSIINGHVYVSTGNTQLTGVTPGPPGAFFDATLRVADDLNGVQDYFITGNTLLLQPGQRPSGASAPVYAADQGVILQSTKGSPGALFVLDPANLGHYTAALTLLNGTADGGAKQRVPLATGQLRGNPAYWQAGGGRTSSSLFVHPEGNPLLKYTLAGGQLTLAASGPAVSKFAGGPGFSTVVSAAAVGAAKGLVWDLDGGSVGQSTLYAYDADDLTAPVAALGSGCSSFDLFAMPAVAGGHIFVACTDKVAVYGLTKVATTGTVRVAPTARTITTQCAVGHPETITATIQPNPPPGPTSAPTGSVIFTLDLTGNANLISLNGGSATLALGTGALVATAGSNVATTSMTPTSAAGAAIWTQLTAATYTITATYGGDGAFIGTTATATFEVDHRCYGS